MDWQKLKLAGEQIVHSVFQIQMSMKSVFLLRCELVYRRVYEVREKKHQKIPKIFNSCQTWCELL